MRPSLAAALLLISASSANAALLGFDVKHTCLDDYIVNDLTIDFDGQLFGQQLVVELDSGSIYQDAFGGETPPNEAFIPVFPSLEWDTFLAMGGLTLGETEDILVVGGSTELGFNTGKKFDSEGINVAWAPAPGVAIDGGVDFPIARITLSRDANGTMLFFSNSGGVPTILGSVQILNGHIGFLDSIHDCDVPEPTSGAILLFGAAVAPLARRRSQQL